MRKSISYRDEQARIIDSLFDCVKLFVESQGIDIDEVLPRHKDSKKGIIKQLFNRGYLDGFLMTQQESDMIGLTAVGVVPSCPTQAAPGSLAKVHVLAMRVANGQELWNPLDADGYDAMPPLHAIECGE